MKNIKHDINNRINNLRLPIRNSCMHEKKLHGNITIHVHNEIIESLYDIITIKITSQIIF